MKKQLTCDCCGKNGVAIKRITRSYGRGTGVVVIDGIPLRSCPHCGENYFTAETLHEVERIRAHRRPADTQRMVPLLSFA